MSAILDRGLTAEQLADCEANDRQLSDWHRQMAASIASIPLDEDEENMLRSQDREERKAYRRYLSSCSECQSLCGHKPGCSEVR